MDPLNEYYDAVRDMFLSRGWSYFLEDIRAFVDSSNDIRKVVDADDLLYKQGQLNVADFVLGFEEAIKTAQQTYEAEEEGEE